MDQTDGEVTTERGIAVLGGGGVRCGSHRRRLSSRVDMRMSADGVVVVFHDDRLDAKTGLEGRVCHYDAAVLEPAQAAAAWGRARMRASDL